MLLTHPAPTTPVLLEYRSCWSPDAGLSSSLLTWHEVWAKEGLHRELVEGSPQGLLSIWEVYVALSSGPVCGMDPREAEVESQADSDTSH